MLNTLINYLSWSEQRARIFQVCQRQYGYRFLEAWGGWMPEASERSRYAYFCNSIVPDLRMITGSIVHDRCGRVLKRLAGGIKSNLSDEIAIAQEDFDKFLSDSLRFPLTALGGKRKKLLAHVYGDTISKAFIAAERSAISIMLGNFFALPEVRLFAEKPELLISDYIEAEMGPPTHELGVPARLVTDAVYQINGVTWVLDFKTGQPRDYASKTVLYDVLLRTRLGLPESAKVKVRVIYLKSGEISDFEFTTEEREEAKWRVGEDFSLLRDKSLDPVANIAPLSSFPARVDGHCLGCSHQLICRDFSAAVARGNFDRSFKQTEVVS